MARHPFASLGSTDESEAGLVEGVDAELEERAVAVAIGLALEELDPRFGALEGTAGDGGLVGGEEAGAVKGEGVGHPVVAMPTDAWGRYEPGQALEQLEGCEAKLLATVDIGLGEPVDLPGLR